MEGFTLSNGWQMSVALPNWGELTLVPLERGMLSIDPYLSSFGPGPSVSAPAKL